MSNNDEEPYSSIFASLKHPVRRKILRMLSKKPMSYSEMLEVLGVSNSFLTYHFENLGELVGKMQDGKYRLSSFGEDAMATMTRVEDIPATTPHQSQQTKPKKIVWKSVPIALGLICIVLIAFTAYFAVAGISAMNSYNNLQNQNKQLQAWLNGNETLLNQTQTWLSDNINRALAMNGTETSLSIIASNPSAWVNRTVMVEGIISLYNPAGWWDPPGRIITPFQLNSNGTTIGVFWQGNVYNGKNVTVLGVVTGGQWREMLVNGTSILFGPVVYYIEAEIVEPF